LQILVTQAESVEKIIGSEISQISIIGKYQKSQNISKGLGKITFQISDFTDFRFKLSWKVAFDNELESPVIG
jgi:hypothetical protein